MSKTTDLQVEKARKIAEGLLRNQARLASKGISLGNLNDLTSEADKVMEASKKCDALRAECSAQVKQTNQLLDTLKQSYAKYRGIIRNNFPQEQWIQFGLQDKR